MPAGRRPYLRTASCPTRLPRPARCLAGPTRCGWGRRRRTVLLESVRVAAGPAGHTGIHHVRVEPQLDVLAERLRAAARAIRSDLRVEAERRGWIVILSLEHADLVCVRRAGRGLAVAGDLTGAGRARSQAGERERAHQCCKEHEF